MTDTSRKYHLESIFTVIIITELVFWGVFIWLYYYLKENSKAFRIEDERYLWGLLIIPVIVVIYLLSIAWKNRAIKRFADSRLLSSIFPQTSTAKSVSQFVLFRLALGLIIIALANPQYGTKKRVGMAEGIEIIIALDVSNSMMAKDLSERSRLEIAKRAINKLLRDQLGSDKVGLVIFAGSAYKYTALTTDLPALMYSVDLVETYMISNQGTDLSNAILTSLTSFNNENQTRKAIIVVSDGENHEPDAVEAATAALDEDVKVYTIGMGTTNGSPIPVYDRSGKQVGYKKDPEGNTVLTKLNENMLREIAEAGGGIYVKATSTDLGLDEIVDDINKIEKTELGETPYLDYADQFLWFLGAGIVLLIPALLIRTETLKGKQKIRLFDI